MNEPTEENDVKDQPKKLKTRPPSPKQPYPGDCSSNDGNVSATHQRLPPQIVPYPESSVQVSRSELSVQTHRPTLTKSMSMSSEVAIENGFKVPESPKPEIGNY